MKHSKTKKFLKKGGYQAGPYASLMNKTSAYSRLGAEGAKVWNNGYILGSQSTGGPTKKAQIGGNQTPGPYASLMNKTSAYSRLGAEGVKIWNNGYLLGSQSTGGPTKKAQVGGKKTKRKQFGGAAAPNYNEGQIVYYLDTPTKTIIRAKISKIHRDDPEGLYFTIDILDQNDSKLRERQTNANKLIPFDLFDEKLRFEIKQVV